MSPMYFSGMRGGGGGPRPPRPCGRGGLLLLFDDLRGRHRRWRRLRPESEWVSVLFFWLRAVHFQGFEIELGDRALRGRLLCVRPRRASPARRRWWRCRAACSTPRSRGARPRLPRAPARAGAYGPSAPPGSRSTTRAPAQRRAGFFTLPQRDAVDDDEVASRLDLIDEPTDVFVVALSVIEICSRASDDSLSCLGSVLRRDC